MKKIGCLVLSLALAGAAVAAPQDSKITLPLESGGQVAPTVKIKASGQNMLTDVVYDVSCLIDNHSGSNVIMRFAIEGYSGTYNYIKLNGKDLTTSQGVVLDQKSDNLMQARFSTYNPTTAAISFLNTDNSAAVTVHDCVGVPATSQTAK